jgi:uncharacterized protein (DUF2252 family)
MAQARAQSSCCRRRSTVVRSITRLMPEREWLEPSEGPRMATEALSPPVPETAIDAEPSPLVSPDRRKAEGKALRDSVPREKLGWWKHPKHRKDPIAILRESDPKRMPALVPIRYGRMLQSPFAFFRGSADVMAEDLSHAPTTNLCVQACGDCHLANFGGFATPERNVLFDINDFDETLPAPWDWDVRRLVASFVLAARFREFSDKQGRKAAVVCARSYRERMQEFSKLDPLRLWYTRISSDDILDSVPADRRKHTQRVIDKALARGGSELAYPKLADAVGGQIHIKDQPPLIFHSEGTLTHESLKLVETMLHGYRDTLAEDRRALLDRYRLVDVAIKTVGIGSVGTWCSVALLMSERNSPLFLQVKQAHRSVLERFIGKSVYPHHGQRVVMGQRLMQPASDLFLGWTTGRGGRHLYLRQLRDAKIKPDIDTFDVEVFDIYAGVCGWALARAHAKTGNISSTISGYLGSSDEFDEAMGDFAVAYADQAEKDHAALKHAVHKGTIVVEEEEHE